MPNLPSNSPYSSNAGISTTQPFIVQFNPRDPTPQDVNFSIQQPWINTVTDASWILEGFSTIGGFLTAVWSKNGSGNLTIETLTGNTGGPVGSSGPPNYNINTLGAAPYTVTGNPATNTLTWSDNGGIAYTYTEDTGVATPAANNLNIFGTSAQGIVTSGAGSTVTITADDATTTQKGVSRLATDAEAIAGSLTTNVVINPDSLKAKLGAQTLNGLAYGGSQTAAVNWLADATNGQLPIGSTGAAPVLANLTSTNGTITVTNGAGSIDLSTSATGTVVLQQVRTSFNTYLTISTTIADANAIPQNTSGTQIFSLSITPKSATSILLIDVLLPVTALAGANQSAAIALFRDAGANALAVGALTTDTGASSGQDQQMKMQFYVSSSSIASTTFNVNAGSGNGGSYSLYINGDNASRLYGGVSNAVMTITEYSS